MCHEGFSIIYFLLKGPEPTFGILPNNNEEEILNQIQQLLELTLQNQAAINRIVGVLENPVASPAYTDNTNQKGKAPMREDINPFGE